MKAEALRVDDRPTVAVKGKLYQLTDDGWKRWGVTCYTRDDAEKVLRLFDQNATTFPEWGPDDIDD